MNSKNTKKRLVASVVAMVMCLTMFIGSTLAWFTDTASTGVNTITAGNLDIELSYKNATAQSYTEVSEDIKDLFVSSDTTNKTILWEPGTVAFCHFKLENVGTLDLKYQMSVNFVDTKTVTDETTNTTYKLSDVLKWGIIDSITEPANPTRDTALTYATKEMTSTTDATTTTMNAGDEKYFTMVIAMPTSVGNEYNVKDGLEIQLGINLVASQVESEKDSFGSDYDKDALAPAFVQQTFSSTTETVLDAGYVTATIPKEASLTTNNSGTVTAGEEAVVLSVVPGAENASLSVSEGAKVETFEISLTTTDGDKVTSSEPIIVTLDIGADRTGNITMYHNSTPMTSVTSESNVNADGEYYYDFTTGIVTLATKSFSPFSVVETFDVKGAGGYYMDLQEAIDAAPKGSTVTLQNDMELDSGLTLASGKELVFDLNGKKITYKHNCTKSYDSFIHVKGDAKLTINDSGEAGSIDFCGECRKNHNAILIYNEGTLVINGGNLTLNCNNIALGYVVDNRPNAWGTSYKTAASLTMNGGVLSAGGEEAVRVAYNSSKDCTFNAPSFTMNGGTLSGYSAVFVQQLDNAYETLNVAINGGTLDVTTWTFRLYGGPQSAEVTYNHGLSGTVNNIAIGNNVTVKGEGANKYYVSTLESTNNITGCDDYTKTSK